MTEERVKCFAFSSLCERVKPLISGFISLEDYTEDYKEDIVKIQCRENVNINLLIKDNKITINNSLIK